MSGVADPSSQTDDEIHVRHLDCGMVVLISPMPWLRTAAVSIAVRGGAIYETGGSGDAESKAGLAGLVSEMISRGAGPHSSRDLVAVQDDLGIDQGGGASTITSSIGSSMPAESLVAAIELNAHILRRPHLPIDQLEDAKEMAMQELRAYRDEPTHRVMKRLREMTYGDPLGRSVQGTDEGIAAIIADDVRDFYTEHYHAGRSIVGVAGNVDPDDVFDALATQFGDWKQLDVPELPSPSGRVGYEHIEMPSSQTHIGFSFDCVPYGHEDYFAMRAGIGILSDGMSSRLFDRVREQRGLCYTISASVNNLPHAAAVFGYAGTTPARAQETLDVTRHEILSLPEGLTQAELDRWKVRIESGLIMEQESSSSRAESLIADWHQLGRVQTTGELQQIIQNLTLERVRDYWTQNPLAVTRVVTLGQEPLDFDSE